MHDANEMECLIFEIVIENIVLGKVTKGGVSDANNKLIINIIPTVRSYTSRPQPLRNRVKFDHCQYLYCAILGQLFSIPSISGILRHFTQWCSDSGATGAIAPVPIFQGGAPLQFLFYLFLVNIDYILQKLTYYY